MSCGFDMYSRTWPNIIFNYWMFIMGFCLPIVIIVLCYIFIIKAVAAQVMGCWYRKHKAAVTLPRAMR